MAGSLFAVRWFWPRPPGRCRGDCCREGRGSRRSGERRRGRPDLLLSPLGRGRVRGCATVDSVRRCVCCAAPIPAFPQRGKEQDRSVARAWKGLPTNAALTLERLAAPGRAWAICGVARSAAGPACPREVARASWTDSSRLFERSSRSERSELRDAPAARASQRSPRSGPPHHEPAPAPGPQGVERNANSSPTAVATRSQGELRPCKPSCC